MNTKTEYEQLCPTDKNPYRLYPNNFNVTPILYDFSLAPDLQKNTFEGNMTMTVQNGNDYEIKCMFFNGEELNIHEVTVYSMDAEKNKYDFPVKSLTYNIETLQYRLEFYNKMHTWEPYYVHIRYSGKIRTDLRGLYASTYKDKLGNSHKMALTQFESADARNMIPCLDEPKFKAKFKATIRMEGSLYNDYTVLFNMPSTKKEALPNGGFVIEFEETPKMSSYLLALVIGELDSISITQNNRKYSIWAPVNQANEAAYALSITPNITEYYENLFGIDYPLPKMDLVAIPDFRAGAMENWGLITFRAAYLLLTGDTTTSVKQYIALVIAHEIMHQWSGNLVSPSWWNNLWLSESFAAFFEYRAVAAVDNSFQVWDAFVSDTWAPSMSVDAFPNSRAISPNEDDVNTVDEIEAMFDTITYSKGASILRMFLSAYGDNFDKWITAHFKQSLYSTANTSTFFSALSTLDLPEEQTKHLSNWILHGGYPYITVEESNGKCVFTQERFLTHEPPSGARSSPLWNVPITYTTTNFVSSKTFFMSDRTLTIDCPNFLKLNSESLGFYRARYTPERISTLRSLVKNQLENNLNGLSESDRANLADDIFSMARAGFINFGDALSFALAFQQEKSYVVWKIIIGHVHYMASILQSESVYRSVRFYALDLFRHISNDLGTVEIASETNERKSLRGAILRQMVFFEDSSVIDTLNSNFDANYTLIAPNLRLAHYEAVAMRRGATAYDLLMDVFDHVSESDQKNILYGLTQTREAHVLKSTLEFVMESGKVRSQDGAYVIRQASRSSIGADLTWDWVRENFQRIVWTFNSRIISGRLVPGVTSRFSSSIRYSEVESFLSSRTPAVALAVALEQISENIHFKAYNMRDLSSWLSLHNYDSPPFSH
eukprot:CAMPEP_0117423700 /NCGR_PEP_ID=MMETSP0758-20121206/4260_1 /TAXON_ID=63605 /ORGANISM="Percolomonas cosmopolitus, Strain AE-1 (ATCC 50343)" /LENGTH=889 /DNA_ID=CAMNT_0005207023 /DNA_START=77 /DNA_END=2746 /DNA_ORIENTATION=-